MTLEVVARMDRLHSVLLSSVALCALAAVLAGCGNADYRPEAIGEEGQVTVVMDSIRWHGDVGDALREELQKPIFTLPVAEPTFDIRYVPLSSRRQFEDVKKFKNVVFVAPLSDTSNVATYLRNLFSEEARQAILNGGSAVVPRRDEWRRRQQIVYVTASTPDELVEAICEEGNVLRHVFNVMTRERMYRDMFERGRQPEIEEQLMQEHGFAVDVQHDYVIAIDTTNFVWLRRILPETWRSLFVYYEENADPSKLSPEWVYATRDSLTRRHIRGDMGGWVEIARNRPLESQEVNFLDRYGIETRGLWEMYMEVDGEKVQAAMGGPFLNYTFYDQESGRIYMIDGMVFAPSFKKREFLRQLEVIAHTFRTEQETEEDVVASED